MYAQFALKLIEIIQTTTANLPLLHTKYIPEYLVDLRDRLEAGNQVTPADKVILETLYRRFGGFVNEASQYSLSSPLKRLARSTRA